MRTGSPGRAARHTPDGPGAGNRESADGRQAVRPEAQAGEDFVTRTIKINATLPTGEKVDLAFPLHPQTQSVTAVSGLVGAVLQSIERDGKKLGKVYASDVLQALGIAMATRALMIDAPARQSQALARDLLGAALSAAEDSKRQTKPVVGHA